MSKKELRAWLAARRPSPPAVLAARLESALETAPAGPLAETGSMREAMSLLGVHLLHTLDGRAPDGDDVALDLLAADAFVTYAFEAAAESGASASSVAQAVLAQVRP